MIEQLFVALSPAGTRVLRPRKNSAEYVVVLGIVIFLLAQFSYSFLTKPAYWRTIFHQESTSSSINSIKSVPQKNTQTIRRIHLMEKSIPVERLTVKANETPEFVVTATQRKFDAIWHKSEDDRSSLLNATITHQEKRGVEIQTQVLFDESTKSVSLLAEKPVDFRPGLYRVSISSNEKGLVNIEQDFTWGVLAINTDKSMYAPNETVKLGMAVLDDYGRTKCFTAPDEKENNGFGTAKLWLTITSPSGQKHSFSTDDQSIFDSGKCDVHSVTNEADFQAEFTPTEKGVYQMHLIGQNQNGKRSIDDIFEVTDQRPFDIAHDAPTRIYPPADYTQKLTITAQEDFKGRVEQFIPESFEIKDSNISSIETKDTAHSNILLPELFPRKNKFNEPVTTDSQKQKILSWQVDWRKGETYTLAFTFKAPNVSPEFYLFSPLQFIEEGSNEVIFQESRSWHIAADATKTWDGGGSGGSAALFTTAANWNNDTVPLAADDLVFTGTGVAAADDANTWNSTAQSTYNSLDYQSGYSGATIFTCPSNSCTVTAALTMNSTSTFTISSQTISVGTSLQVTNTGTLTATSSTVTMIGTGNLNSNKTFVNFTINGNGATVTTVTNSPSVSGTLTIGAAADGNNDTLSIGSGLTLTVGTAGTLTIHGSGTDTISGAGTLVMQSSNLSTNGTISSIVRFDATSGNINMPARTYGGDVEFYSNSTTARTVTMLTGTHTISGNLHGRAENTNSITLSGTNNPTVNITGNLDYTGVGSGSEIINPTGTGIWTVSGNIDFTGGTVTFSTNSSFKMNGSSKTLTSASQSFYDFEVSGGSVTAQDATVIISNLTVSSGTFALGANNLTVGSTGVTNSGSIKVAGTISQSSSATTTVRSSASGANCIGANGASCAGTPGTIGFHNLTIGDASTTITTSIGGTSPTVTVGGVLNITTNATFRLSSTTTLTLSGTGTPITKTGTFDVTTNTGSITQYTSGSGITALSSAATTYHHLTINGTGTFTAGVVPTINGDLTVTAGTFALGANDMTVGSTGNTNSGSVKVASGGTISQSSAGTTQIKSSASGSNCIGANGASCAGTPGTIGFYNLTIGDGSTTITTSLNGTSVILSVGYTFFIDTNATFVPSSTSQILLNSPDTGLWVDGTFNVTTNPGSTVEYTSTTGITDLTFDQTDFYHLKINGTGTFNSTNDVVVLGDLTVASGTLDIDTNLTVGSTSYSNSGSVKVASGATLIDGNSTTILSSASGSNCIGANSSNCSTGTAGTINFHRLTIGNNSTTFTTTINGGVAPTVTVAENLDITTNATLSANGTLNVGGAWQRRTSSTFTANSSTVNLNGAGGTTQTVSGSNSFYTLTASASSARTIEFEAGSTTTIAANGNLSLNGSCNNLLTIKSSSNGSAWTLTRNTGGSGTTSLTYLSVRDSTATNALTATSSTSVSGNTNWTITNVGICSTNAAATGYSFQRKTIYDATNDRHWQFYHDGSEIDIRYSSDDGSNWNAITSLAYNTNDFSLWNKKIGSTEYVWLAVTDSNDIKVRQGTLSTTSITWDADVATIFDGTGAADTYAYPHISLDSSNYLWSIVRYYNGTNYSIKTRASATTADTDPSTWTYDTATQLSDDQTVASSNVFGNIVPLASGDMYAAFINGTAFEGCKWVDASSAWQDSAGNSCAVVSGSAQLLHPTKVDESGDPGAMLATSQQSVRTSTGILYSVVNDGGSCEIWKQNTTESNWEEMDAANNPACSTTEAVGMAIGTDDVIQLIYIDDDNTGVMYNTFDTEDGGAADDAFNTEEQISAGTAAQITGFDLAVDSNNKPHMVYNTTVSGFAISNVVYYNKVSGSWSATTIEEDLASSTRFNTTSSIVISEDNIPEIAYFNITDADLTAAVGNANNATSFTLFDVDATVNVTNGTYGADIGVDANGNTWITYIDATSSLVYAIQHVDASAWTTWSTAVTNSNAGKEPSLVVDGLKLYLFYTNDTDDIAYDTLLTTAWRGESTLHTGTFQDVKARWSFIGNNYPGYVDYVFSDGTDIYWDFVTLPRLIDGAGDWPINFGAGQKILRTSNRTLYATGQCEIWKSTDEGMTWSEQDASNNPTTCLSTSDMAMDIDAQDTLHLAYLTASAVIYRQFNTSTDTFGSTETVGSLTSFNSNSDVDIAVDSNGVPHIVVNDSSQDLYYNNRVGGSFGSDVTVEVGSVADPDIVINEDNVPEIAYENSGLNVALGNVNDATSFTLHDIDLTIGPAVAIGVDELGNTWVAYLDDATPDLLAVVKHNDADGWTTWQTPVVTSSGATSVALHIQGTSLHIVYLDENADVAYDKYDGNGWVGERKFETGAYQTPRMIESLNHNTLSKLDFLVAETTGDDDMYYFSLDLNLMVNDAANSGSLINSIHPVVRTSTGDLYSAINDSGSCEIWKSTDEGGTWIQQDTADNPACTDAYPIDLAVDGGDDLHMIYQNSSAGILSYNSFDTQTAQFGTAGNIQTAASATGINDYAIAVDSNSIPHVIYTFSNDDNASYTTRYSNRVGGSWDVTPVTLESNRGKWASIVINEDNIPEISYLNEADSDITAAIGNQNDAASFTLHDIDATALTGGTTSIAVDSSGNTWVSYIDSNSDVTLVKHNDADGWTTWQSSTANGNDGTSPSLAVQGTDVYVFYENDFDNIVFDKYDGSTWNGEVFLASGATFENVKTRSAYYHNASYLTYGIDYVFSNGTDFFYKNLSLGSGSAVQDAIDTVPSGVSKNLSAVVDTSNYDVHLMYIDDESTDQVSYKRYDNGTNTWQSAINLDASNNDAYVSLSLESSTQDLYAFYTDTSSGTIYYRTCDVSAAASECSTSGDWVAEVSWKTGTNTNISSNYSGSSEIFALWGDGASTATIMWDRLSISAVLVLTQNDFEWFVTANSVTLTNNWPSGNGTDLAENEVLTQLPATNMPLKTGDQIRIQINFTVSGAALSATDKAFKLQYSAAEDCTSASSWTDVGAKASGSIWRLYDEASIGDSTTQVNQISTSNSGAEGYYSEINPSGTNPNAVSVGQNSEWDWPVENNGASENTSYCFRMIESTGTAFSAYNSDSYPHLYTAPGASNFMRHGRFFQNDTKKGFFWTN